MSSNAPSVRAAGRGIPLETYRRCGYTVAELKSKRDALLETNSKLQLEEARLQRPDRIDAYARQNLGLQPTTEGQVVRLEPVLPVVEGEAVVAAARFRMPTSR